MALFLFFTDAYCNPQQHANEKLNLSLDVRLKAIESISQPNLLNQKRLETLQHMQQVMGKLPQAPEMPLQVRESESTCYPDFIKKKILYSTRDLDKVSAYLLVPMPARNNMPAFVCLHETVPIGKSEVVGDNGNKNMHYGLELVRRGYVVIAPDFMNFGEYSYDPYANGYTSATLKGIVNHMRAVDVLTSLEYVDPNRIGCIGHSLGGYNALFLAAFDLRIKIVVSSCGFNSFHFYKKGNLANWATKNHMPLILSVYHNNPCEMPFDFPDVLATLVPRHVIISAPLHDHVFDINGVYPCIKAAKHCYNISNEQNNLKVFYPDTGHNFPDEIREIAYEMIDTIFMVNTASK